jgi:hypothetical protein
MMSKKTYPFQHHFGLGIDHLWLLAALGGFGVLLSLAPQPPHDFWWHLKLGEIITTSHAIPDTNLFGWTLSSDTPYVYGAWLAEFLLYRLYQWGGVSLLLFTRTGLALAAFGLLGFEAYRKSGSWRISGVVTAIACLMAASNLIVRPQIWSWIPFVLYLILLGAFADGKIRARWLLICPVLMMFWVNVHGSFILGFVLILIFLCGEAIRSFLRLEGYRPWQEVGWIGMIGAITMVALLVNPHGVGIIQYVVRLMTDQSSQTLVAEWQSPNPRDLGSLFFFIGVLILIAVWAYQKYHPTPSETLMILAFLWLAFSGVRYVIWFALIATPVLARSLKSITNEKSWADLPKQNVINIILSLVLFLPAVMVQPWWIEYLPFPNTYWTRVWKGVQDGPMLSTQTPVRAVNYLRQHPGGIIFNEMGYGSYMIWALPEQEVFIDPRVELYPYNLWLDYIKISNGINYNSLLQKYGADRLIVDTVTQAGLISALQTDPIWRQEYADPYTQIWWKIYDHIRNSADNWKTPGGYLYTAGQNDYQSAFRNFQ